ncbi:MAG: hypothetical protein RJA57_1303, partial [Bacteroidota bacterium]
MLIPRTISWFFLLTAATLRAQTGRQPEHPFSERIESIRMPGTQQAAQWIDSNLQREETRMKRSHLRTDSMAVAERKLELGHARYRAGDYEAAEKEYRESIALLEGTGDLRKLAIAHQALASLYRKTRVPDRSLEQYEKAASLFASARDSAGMARVWDESGLVYEYLSDYREALRRYTSSLELAQRLGDSLTVSYSLSKLAGVHVIEGKYDLAESLLLRCLRIRETLGDSIAMALAYSDLGLAMNAKGDATKATDYLTASNRLAEPLQYAELISTNYNELARAASRQGNYQQAYGYFIRHSRLRDSLVNLQSSREIQRLNTRYERAQREQKLANQQNRIRTQTYLIAGILMLVVFGVGWAYTLNKRFRLRKEHQLQSEILRQQELKARAILEAEEKERERIAKDLHDGVGQMLSALKMNLSALESEIPFADPEQRALYEKAIGLIDESCREVRTVSHVMMPNALLRNHLDGAIREFVNRIHPRTLQVQVHTEGLDTKLHSDVETVLYRVIQEC